MQWLYALCIIRELQSGAAGISVNTAAKLRFLGAKKTPTPQKNKVLEQMILCNMLQNNAAISAVFFRRSHVTIIDRVERCERVWCVELPQNVACTMLK